MTHTLRQDASAPQTVIIMPESDARTLCVRLVGAVTRSDYERFFYQTLQKFVEAETPFGLLIDYTDYKGWEENAAARSFESIIDHGRFARKMAYVAAPESKTKQMEVARPLLAGEMRFFKKGELAQAVLWVKED